MRHFLNAVTDFGSPVPSQLLFNVGTTIICTAIMTINDIIHEENELFSVALSSTSNGVNIGTGATVQITDNDSEYFHSSSN